MLYCYSYLHASFWLIHISSRRLEGGRTNRAGRGGYNTTVCLSHLRTLRHAYIRMAYIRIATDFGLISSLLRQWEAFVTRHRLVVGCTSISGCCRLRRYWLNNTKKTKPLPKPRTFSFRPFHFRNLRIQWEITTRKYGILTYTHYKSLLEPAILSVHIYKAWTDFVTKCRQQNLDNEIPNKHQELIIHCYTYTYTIGRRRPWG